MGYVIRGGPNGNYKIQIKKVNQITRRIDFYGNDNEIHQPMDLLYINIHYTCYARYNYLS